MGYLVFLLPLMCLVWSWILGVLMLLRRPVCLTGTTAAWIWTLSWGLSWVPVALMPDLLNCPGIGDSQVAGRIPGVLMCGLVGVAGVYWISADFYLVNFARESAIRAVCGALEEHGLQYRLETPWIWVETPIGERRGTVKRGGFLPTLSIRLPKGLPEGLAREIARTLRGPGRVAGLVAFPYPGCLMLVVLHVVLVGLIVLLSLPVT